MRKLLIPQNDYEQIFNTIYSILVSVNISPTRSCHLYAILGSTILKEYYSLEAYAVFGSSGYMLDKNENQFLLFGKVEESIVISTDKDYHSWIEVDGWMIDFMASNLGLR